MRPPHVHARNDHDAGASAGARAAARQSVRLAEQPRRGGPGMSVELEPGRGAAAEARAALTVLDGRIDRDALGDIRLLVSELVTNSVRHSGAGRADRVRLDVASHGRTVRVEVSDGGRGFEPRPRAKPSEEPGGWGLHLVERIATRWGVQTGRRTRVWFEIDVQA